MIDHDKIQNAVLIGMSKEDAYIYAGLTPEEIRVVEEDEPLQRRLSQYNKTLEYSLLSRLKDIGEKQVRMGKEGATTWMLEHLYPRYSGKPTTELPDIHLHLDPADASTYDNVEIHR